MGLDGGTIPTRGELVKVKEKPEQKDKLCDMLHKWKNCTLSQQPLQEPVVTCHLGMLYNKESVLELLLCKSQLRDRTEFNHIESRKDICDLKLTRNRVKTGESSYICPVTGLEMNGRTKFVCLWNCRCVLSERAIIKVKSSTCHSCGQPWDVDDIVILNPGDDVLPIMLERMRRRKSESSKHSQRGEICSVPSKSYREAAEDVGSTSLDSKQPDDSVFPLTKKRCRYSDKNNGDEIHGTSNSKTNKVKKLKKQKKHKKYNRDKSPPATRAARTDDTPALHPGWDKFFK